MPAIITNKLVKCSACVRMATLCLLSLLIPGCHPRVTGDGRLIEGAPPPTVFAIAFNSMTLGPEQTEKEYVIAGVPRAAYMPMIAFESSADRALGASVSIMVIHNGETIIEAKGVIGEQWTASGVVWEQGEESDVVGEQWQASAFTSQFLKGYTILHPTSPVSKRKSAPLKPNEEYTIIVRAQGTPGLVAVPMLWYGATYRIERWLRR